jgi:hypothetical protein
MAVRALLTLVLVGGVVLCAETVDGSDAGFAGSYLFIYLFLINACNRKVMARSTELNTIIGT